MSCACGGSYKPAQNPRTYYQPVVDCFILEFFFRKNYGDLYWGILPQTPCDSGSGGYLKGVLQVCTKVLRVMSTLTLELQQQCGGCVKVVPNNLHVVYFLLKKLTLILVQGASGPLGLLIVNTNILINLC